jgi:acyl-phosphate glycerol 3-phosphate acyltransferase
MNTLIPLLLIIANYLIGSISSAIIVAKYIKKKDIREVGDKKAGGSNVSREIGLLWGIVVGIFDIVKPLPLLYLSKYVLKVEDTFIPYIAIAATAGHCWPIWFSFSGGRGIATYFGIILFLTPKESILPILLMVLSIIPSILIQYIKIDLKYVRWISSPILTLISLGSYIVLTSQTEIMWDDTLAVLIFLLVIFRRVTARMGEYPKTDSPIRLFFSRLLFDNDKYLL